MHLRGPTRFSFGGGGGVWHFPFGGLVWDVGKSLTSTSQSKCLHAQKYKVVEIAVHFIPYTSP